MYIFAPLFGKTPSGRHINKDAELAFICGYRNLANSMLCRDNAMVIVHNFGIYCSKYHTKSVGRCIAYLTQQGNARASIAG